MPLCSLITARGPNLIMSRKDRYIDIKDAWLCYDGGEVLYSPSSMEFRSDERVLNFPLVQKVLGSYLNIFHQLSIVKYNSESGRLREGRGFRRHLRMADNA